MRNVALQQRQSIRLAQQNTRSSREMSKHLEPRTPAKRNRVLAISAIAGCTVGFGALAALGAPTANADDWWFFSGNDTNIPIGVNGNGNTTQFGAERQYRERPSERPHLQPDHRQRHRNQCRSDCRRPGDRRGRNQRSHHRRCADRRRGNRHHAGPRPGARRLGSGRSISVRPLAALESAAWVLAAWPPLWPLAAWQFPCRPAHRRTSAGRRPVWPTPVQSTALRHSVRRTSVAQPLPPGEPTPPPRRAQVVKRPAERRATNNPRARNWRKRYRRHHPRRQRHRRQRHQHGYLPQR